MVQDYSDKLMRFDPNVHPMFDRYKRFSQAEAMEWFLSGRPPEPEIIPGIVSSMTSPYTWEWPENE